MVQIRPGVAEDDLPRDEEQACIARAPATTRGAGRLRERGGENAWGAARVVSGCGRLPQQAGGLPAGRFEQPATEFWRGGVHVIDLESRPMRIDDDEEQEEAVGTPKATSSTRAAYASFSTNS